MICSSNLASEHVVVPARHRVKRFQVLFPLVFPDAPLVPLSVLPLSFPLVSNILPTVYFRLLCKGGMIRYACLRQAAGNWKGVSTHMRCYIRIKGLLDPSWQDWFGGLEIVQEQEG